MKMGNLQFLISFPFSQPKMRRGLTWTMVVLTMNLFIAPMGSYADPLHQAAAKGDRVQLEALIEQGANLSKPDRTGRTPLHWAAWKGQAKTVEYLLKQSVVVNSLDHRGRSPLWLAVDKGHLETVAFLLAHRANVNLPNKKGATPLYQAVLWNYSDLILLLLEHGADPNTSNQVNSMTPLIQAVTAGSLKTVRILLKHGADPNLGQDFDGKTALQVAQKSPNVGQQAQLVSLLLEHGAQDPEKLQDAQRTVEDNFITAIEQGKFSQVKSILDQGLHLNSQDLSHAALKVAIPYGHTDITRLLLNHGVNPNFVSHEGVSLLEAAIVFDYAEITRTLLDHGANPNPLSDRGRAPLDEAIKHGRADMIPLLIDRGARLHPSEQFASTPLHVAVEASQLEIVEQLLVRGIGINRRAHILESLRTALHLAAFSGKESIVQLLLDRGADVTLTDSEGWTPLQLAVKHGHIGVVRLLLGTGASPSAVTQDGKTLLHLAAEQGSSEMATLLLGYGADVREDWDGQHPGEDPYWPYDANPPFFQMVDSAMLETRGDPLSYRIWKQRPWRTPLTVVALEKALTLFPQARGVILRDLGQVYLDHGDYEEAVGPYREALELFPHDHTLFVQLAMAYGKAGNLVQAVKVLREGLQKRPTSLPLLEIMGWLFATQGNLPQAIKTLNLAIAKAPPNLPDPFLTLAVFSHLAGDDEAAGTAYNQALARDPDTTRLWGPLARRFFEAGFPDQGLVFFKQLFSEESNDREALDAFLTVAVAEGYEALVTTLLDMRGPSFPHELTFALHQAIEKGHMELVTLLLDRGVPINPWDMTAETPLHVAIRHDQPYMVQLLLARGAGINRRARPALLTPLHLAVGCGNQELVSLLLARGAEPRFSSREVGLHIAVEEGDVDLVKALLLDKTNINMKTRGDGLTPLHVAVRQGASDLITLLLEHGADPEDQTEGGATPREIAQSSGHSHLLAGLTSAKTEPTIPNGYLAYRSILQTVWGKPSIPQLIADLKQFPDDRGQISLKLGKAHMERLDYAHAIDWYEQSLDYFPTDLSLVADLARAQAKAGHQDQAVVLLRKGLEANPHNLHLLNSLAQVFVEQSNLDGAVKTLLHATKAKPNIPAPFLALSSLYKQTDQLKLAIEAYKEAFSRDPEAPRLWGLSFSTYSDASDTWGDGYTGPRWKTLAELYQQALLDQEASDFFTKVVKLNWPFSFYPVHDFIDTYCPLSSSKDCDGQGKRGLAAIPVLTEAGEKGEIIRVYEEAGEYDKAIEVAKSAGGGRIWDLLRLYVKTERRGEAAWIVNTQLATLDSTDPEEVEQIANMVARYVSVNKAIALLQNYLKNHTNCLEFPSSPLELKKCPGLTLDKDSYYDLPIDMRLKWNAVEGVLISLQQYLLFAKRYEEALPLIQQAIKFHHNCTLKKFVDLDETLEALGKPTHGYRKKIMANVGFDPGGYYFNNSVRKIEMGSRLCHYNDYPNPKDIIEAKENLRIAQDLFVIDFPEEAHIALDNTMRSKFADSLKQEIEMVLLGKSYPFLDRPIDQKNLKEWEALLPRAEDSSTWRQVSQAYLKLGQEQKARLLIAEALKRFPACRLLRYDLAVLYLAQGLSPKALELFSPTSSQVSSYLSFPDDYLMLAKIYTHLGETQKAKETYETAVEFFPTLAEAWHKLGLNYIKDQEYVSGLEALTKAVKFAPKDPDFNMNLGWALYLIGEDKSAEEYLTKAKTHYQDQGDDKGVQEALSRLSHLQSS